MNIEEIKKLKRNISRIYKNDDTESIHQNRVKIEKITHKYSNTKVPVYRFFIDDIVIKKNNKYKVEYLCIVCERRNDVSLNNITRKMNKGITFCASCRNLDETKRRNQKQTWEDKRNGIERTKKEVPPIQDKLIYDKKSFEDMDDDFKEMYFKRHLDIDEFEYIRPKIVSVGNGILIKEYEYIPYVSISNQTRFNPYLYNKNDDTILKIHNIQVKCDNCSCVFVKKDITSLKNRIKALCSDCNLTNNTFKLRKYHNLKNESIMYQSKFELKFIRFCNENKIIIENGPKISYEFNNKNRTYRVDFFIPRLNLLIEIKDNHKWHQEQVTSGKWNAKICGVQNFIDTNPKYDFFDMIFPKNFVSKTKKIVKRYFDNTKI